VLYKDNKKHVAVMVKGNDKKYFKDGKEIVVDEKDYRLQHACKQRNMATEMVGKFWSEAGGKVC